MSPEFVSGYMTEAIKVALYLAGPILGFGLVAGLLVSIFQAVTQINEMTLVFIPKMVAVGVALVLFFPWMLKIIVNFTQTMLMNIPLYIH
jgi:flagellar biosynthetic protein FliQ